jgi:hypothetical protein
MFNAILFSMMKEKMIRKSCKVLIGNYKNVSKIGIIFTNIPTFITKVEEIITKVAAIITKVATIIAKICIIITNITTIIAKVCIIITNITAIITGKMIFPVMITGIFVINKGAFSSLMMNNSTLMIPIKDSK